VRASEPLPAAVSFDVTGTLLGLPRLGEIYAECFARHGLSAPPAALAQMVREVWQELSIRTSPGEDRFSHHEDGVRGFWRELVNRVAERLALPPPTPFLAAELYERFAHAEAWEVFADARDVLPRLRAAGVRLAVASNFDRRLPRLLDEAGVAPHLDTIVYSEEVGVEKPHPALFEELLGRLALPAARVLHVGDSRRDDVEGAHAVGMRALWLQRGGHGAGGRGGDLASLSQLPARLGIAVLAAALLLPLAACGRKETRSPAAAKGSDLPTEEVAPPPDARVDLTKDEVEKRHAETFSGVLPGGFPRGLPLPPQASLVDQGPRWVEVLVPRHPAAVQEPYLGQLRGAGWSVRDGGQRAWSLRKGASSVRLELHAQGPSTRLRLSY